MNHQQAAYEARCRHFDARWRRAMREQEIRAIQAELDARRVSKKGLSQ